MSRIELQTHALRWHCGRFKWSLHLTECQKIDDFALTHEIRHCGPYQLSKHRNPTIQDLFKMYLELQALRPILYPKRKCWIGVDILAEDTHLNRLSQMTRWVSWKVPLLFLLAWVSLRRSTLGMRLIHMKNELSAAGISEMVGDVACLFIEETIVFRSPCYH